VCALLLLLLQMFGPEAPPLPWDADGEYSRDKVELYYLSNAGQQLQQVSQWAFSRRLWQEC
jgi:hypothetical protein